jgi:hypothetical protein
MKLRLTVGYGLAALTMAGMAFTTRAQAQSALFPSSGGNQQYGLLNGDNLALYVDQFGDLGAPVNFNQTIYKPSGDYTGGHPNIDPTTGAVLEPGSGSSRTYAALYSSSSTGGISPIGASVLAKNQEYITVGPSLAAAGWGVKLGGSWLPYYSPSLNFQGFSVSGSSAGSLLSATSSFAPTSTLAITQTVSINSANPNRANFEVTFDNSKGTSAVSNVAYSFMLNPNQGEAPDGSSNTIATANKYQTTDTSAFAINAEANSLNLGLGVLPSDQVADPNEMENGSTLYTTTDVKEGDVLGNPETNGTNPGNLNPYVVLNPDGTVDYFDPNSILYPLADATDPNFADAFPDAAFTGGSDTAMVLLSPSFDIPAGGIRTFEFYLFFNPAQTGPTVPEPGAMSLLAGGVLSFGGLLLRRRNRK